MCLCEELICGSVLSASHVECMFFMFFKASEMGSCMNIHDPHDLSRPCTQTLDLSANGRTPTPMKCSSRSSAAEAAAGSSIVAVAVV